MRNDFNRDWNNMRRFAVVAAVVQLAIVAVVLGFAGWVAVKLLQHFGVV